MPSPQMMSTEQFAPRERVAVWREWMWNQFEGLECDVYGDTSFDGRLDVRHAGDVVLTRLEANRHRVTRTAPRPRASDSAYLKIVAPQHGSAAVVQQDRQSTVGAGSWTIYDTTDRYTVSCPQSSDHLVVMVPKTRLLIAGLPLGDVTARHVGGTVGISRITLETFRKTWQELPHMNAASAHGSGEVILQLVQMSLLELAGQRTESSQPGLQRELQRDRVRQVIARHLRDPGLGVNRLAELLNCSTRHLHSVFAGSGETLAESIQRQRLDACMRELRTPELAARSITEIALSWGFSNVSHFSRVFRAHAGCSPSEYRAAP